MKTSYFVIIACILFTLLASPLLARTTAEYRKDMIDETRKELIPIEAKALSASSLGAWKDIIDSSLFLILRKTELYRGSIRVVIIDDSEVKVRLYPDGTFVISTGLLDFIDQSLFEATSESPQRIRNFDSEREAMLVPFLAPEAAHFALGHPFADWSRSNETNMTPSDSEILDADRFSVILLDIAGLDSKVIEESFAALTRKIDNGTLSPDFAAYLNPLPSPENQLKAIQNSQTDLERVSAEFGIVLDALKRGTAFREAQDSINGLSEKFPGSPYIARLGALVAHQRWLETVPPTAQILPTLFPFASDGADDRQGFMALVDRTDKSPVEPNHSKIPATPPVSGRTAVPGNAAFFAEADKAYEHALSMLDEPGLSSSYAALLVQSGKTEMIPIALGLALNAANREAETRSFIARANLANLLFLTGTDYAKAQYLIDNNSSQQTTVSDTRYLDTGIPGDSRDLVLSHAIMLSYLGDTKKAASKLAEVKSLMTVTRTTGSIDLRHLHIGNSPDELAECWGRPASIIYNYPTETWNYPALSASVKIEKKVTLVKIFAHSPLSPGNDIRTGDTRADFEKIFGNPAYRAGDNEVYLKDGNKISVLYLADKIRSMNIGL